VAFGGSVLIYGGLSPLVASDIIVNPMTAKGDIIYSSDDSGTTAALHIGSPDQALCADESGRPCYKTLGPAAWMQVNIPGGLPQLDMDGSIPPEFLPYETMTYRGTFGSAASTTGGDLPASGALDGDVYVCAAAEYYSQVAQASFIAGQQAIYSGAAWDAVPVAATVGDSVPVGGILPYAGSAASIPPNYLPCNGYILSKETYFLLFSAIGTAYNTGAESSAQFSIPNYNGEGRFLQGGWKLARGWPPDCRTSPAQSGWISPPHTPVHSRSVARRRATPVKAAIIYSCTSRHHPAMRYTGRVPPCSRRPSSCYF
jgi:hypothetical protein